MIQEQQAEPRNKAQRERIERRNERIRADFARLASQHKSSDWICEQLSRTHFLSVRTITEIIGERGRYKPASVAP
jgi:hypothetical protein